MCNCYYQKKKKKLDSKFKEILYSDISLLELKNPPTFLCLIKSNNLKISHSYFTESSRY